MWVPVTTVWRVLGLQMGIAANILDYQSRTADKGWSSSLGGLGEGLINVHLENPPCYEMSHRALGLDGYFGTT